PPRGSSHRPCRTSGPGATAAPGSRQQSCRETGRIWRERRRTRQRTSDTSQNSRPADPADADDICGRPERHVLLLCDIPDALETVDHDAVEFLSDTGQVPVEVLAVLDPFEIAYRNTSRVGQNIGNDQDITFV